MSCVLQNLVIKTLNSSGPLLATAYPLFILKRHASVVHVMCVRTAEETP
jgi:hypothetical protein